MFIPFCSCNNPTETPEKNVSCCYVLGISSFQGLKTYTPRKDSTNIWKTHVLPYHLLLQVPSRPIPANKASSAQSLVPFTMSGSWTVDRGFDSKKCIQTNPELGELYFHQNKINNYIFRVRSYDVFIMGLGGWDPIQTKQLGVFPAENGFQKHMYGPVLYGNGFPNHKIISRPKETWYNQRITTNALHNCRNLHCSYKTGFPTSFTF